MIAAFGDFDVSGVARRGEQARRGVVIEEYRQARRARGRSARRLAVDGLNDVFDLAGADDRVHFGNLLANLVAKALDQAAGDDQALRAAEFLVFGHLQDGVDGFLLRRLDEAAGIDDEHVGFVGARRQFVAVARQNAHHDLAIDEVLGTAQAEESNLGECRQARRSVCSDSSTRVALAFRPFPCLALNPTVKLTRRRIL